MKVCIFLSANIGYDPSYVNITKQLAHEIADRNITLVYGGANDGLMGILADTILEKSGRVIGVMPAVGLSSEIAHRGLSELIFVPDIEIRKQKMVELSDAFIALPGGLGTFEEIFKIWNATKLNQINKPLFILNINGYYDSLLKMMNHAVAEGFLKKEHVSLINILDDPLILIQKLEQKVNEMNKLDFNHIEKETAGVKVFFGKL